jgi:hypothetical protein
MDAQYQTLDRGSCTRSTSAFGARVALAIFAASSIFFAAVTLSPLKSGFAHAPARGPGDIALYRAEIDRIHAGDNYYSAANDELRSRGYPTRSAFNWRTPLPMWLVGKLPTVELGKAILGGFALALLLMAFGLMRDEGTAQSSLLAALLLAGALMPVALGDLFVMTELWSGTLLALSAVAYGLRRRWIGVSAGLAALFLRELAAPYCLVCLFFAVRNRQRAEVLTWLLGFAAYACFYAVHLSNVLPLIRAEDAAHQRGWICFGGAGFVISAAQMNAWLLLLPQWVTALYLAAAMLGLAGWNSPAGQRIGLTVAIYLIVFSIVGQPINQYWGSMIAPLLCLGAARFPMIFRELQVAARNSQREMSVTL